MTLGSRRFAAAVSCGALIVVAVFLLFSWTAPGGFFGRTPFNLGGFYDSQARALFHGHWNANADAFFVERITIGGKYYMYFGPWPSFLRMPLLLVTSGLDGKLTHLSLLIAVTTLLVAVGRLLWDIRGLMGASDRPSRSELLAVAGFVALVGCGSTVVFLSASAWVYDEAILWGAAWATWSLHFVVSYIRSPSRARLALACMTTTLAILSRQTAGAIGTLLLGGLFVVNFVMTRRHQRVRDLGARLARITGVDDRLDGQQPWSTLVAAVVPIGAFVAVNEARFGTLFRAPFEKQDLLLRVARRRQVLAANGNGFVSWREVPTNVVRYFRPDGLTLHRLFPFIDFGDATRVLGHVARDPENPTASVTVTATLLLLLAVGGAAVVFAPKLARHVRADDTRVLRMPVVASAVIFLPTLVFPAASERYKADLVPLFVTAGAVGLYAGARLVRRHGRKGALVVAIAVILAAFNVCTNLALTLDFQRGYGSFVSANERAGYVSNQIKWTRRFGLEPRASFVDWDPRTSAGRPPAAPIGTFLSIADCSQLQLSDGYEWLELHLRDPGSTCRALGYGLRAAQP